MSRLIYFLVVTLFLVSCELKDIDFGGMESYKLDKFENNEAHVSLKLKVKNDNWFNLKVKPSKLTVSAEGKEMGTLFLDKKVKIKGNKDSVYDAKIRFKFADGAMFSMPGLMLKEQVNLTFVGKVKGGVFIFSKKIKVNETKTLATKDMKFNFFQ